MDDALPVRRLQCVGDLFCDYQGFVSRQWTTHQAIGERRPLDQLHDDGRGPVGFFEAVDVRDVLVIERREELGFPLEAREAIMVGRERLRQNLYRDVAAELRIARAIDL